MSPILKFVLVASGSISQNNQRFSEQSKNNQCVCISVATCVYVENVKRSNLSTENINQLIIDGDAYYVKTKENLGNTHRHNYLNIDEVAEKLTINGEEFNVKTFFKYAGLYPGIEEEIEDCTKTLITNLEHMFGEHEDSGFVFLGRNVAISLWKSDCLFFVFDSHSTDENARYTLNGVGRLFSFKDLSELATFLLRRMPLNKDNRQYEISRVVSNRAEPILQVGAKRKMTREESSDSSTDDIPLINLKYAKQITGIEKSKNEIKEITQVGVKQKKTHEESYESSDDNIPLIHFKDSKQITGTGKSKNKIEGITKVGAKRKITREESSDSSAENIPLQSIKQPKIKKGRPTKKSRGRPKATSLNNDEKNHSLGGRPSKTTTGRPKTSLLTEEEQHRESVKKYTQKHPEVHRKAVKTYNEVHPDVHRVAVRTYSQNHPQVNESAVEKYRNINPGLHLPTEIRKDGNVATWTGNALDKIKPYRLKNPSLQSPDTHKCSHCGARLFEEEKAKAQWCCGKGRYNVMSFQPLSDPIFNDRLFLQHPRMYNDLFSFCALSVPLGYHHPRGLSFMKILGRTYHMVYDLNCGGTNNTVMYIDDGTARLAEGEKRKLSQVIIKKIETFLTACNPYVSLYKKLHDEPSENARLEFETTSRRTHGPVLGDRPTSTEVSAILSCDESNPPRGKFCIWKKGNANPRIIDANNFLVEPFQYPLLYPEGQPGWHIGRTTNERPPRKLSLLKYTRCLLLSEERFSRFGPLSDTWLIDMYARIEGQRLGYLQLMQKKARQQGGLRTGPMDEVLAAAVPNEILQDETVQGEGQITAGRVYLPQTFTGGPRYMKTRYMDSMALVSRMGGPTYFLTFTACGGWEEIKLSKQRSSNQEAHLCNRVFELKLKELLRDIKSGAFFGKISYVIYVVEFQMRGLPHAHICFSVADGGPKQNTEIDRIVRADIPSHDEANGRLRKLVLQHMMHGPCGLEYRTDLPCWDDKIKKCTKFFPKPHTETTYTDEKGFVHYRRNAANKALIHFRGKMIEVDDRWVVPYNPGLLLKYECHINLEIASASGAVKYLFKYITKGSSLRRMKVVHEEEDIDEVEEYVTKRYIGATDAAWRILEYDLTGRDPTVIHLPVHLKDKHNVIFRPGNEQEAVDNSTSKLILYFGRPNIEELDNITYLHFYEKYIVHVSRPKSAVGPVECSDGKHFVTRRQRGECVARMFWVAPNRGELYYLRLLLTRYPCRNYEDLYALGGPECNTFQQAARELGLADNRNEYYEALEEAGQFMKADRLREFFVLLSTLGCPVQEIWEKYKRDLCEDFLHHYFEDEEKAFKLGLIHIDRCLRRHGSSLLEAGLPVVDDDSTELGREKLMYSSSVEKAFIDEWEPRLSPQQLKLLNYVKSITNGECDKKVVFLDGPGGSGKTLLLRVISSFIRSKDKIVLCVASSGIAAQNLAGGTTAHSLFRLPLEIRDDTFWSITNGTQRAELIREASMIIFDEAPMAHKQLLEMLDRSLRDLMQNDVLFGDKLVILAGDFRQIPPVVQNARTLSDIVQSSVRQSYIWKMVQVFQLITSHRLREGENFADFLLKIGSDTIEKREFGEGSNLEQLVALPQLSYVTDLKEFIDNVFPLEILQKPDECSKRAIICTLNENVNEVNDLVLRTLDGEAYNLYSLDSVAEDDGVGNDIDEALLHHAQGKGVPKHVLTLKVGSICMVTRNLNFNLGLVNGTKVIIVAITRRLITCRRPGCDELFGIPRITFKFPMYTKSPIEMYRRQFPVQLCYAITIHKSQGQTIDFVGLDLRSDAFTHGQLYVALSRVRSPENIRLLVNPDRVIEDVPYTKNIVYKQLL